MTGNLGIMKLVLFICASLLFLALARLPIGYYTFLRVVVTTGAVLAIIADRNLGLHPWTIGFAVIALLFNPVVPVYLYIKSAWMPLDLGCGVMFLVKAVTINERKH